MSGLSLDEWMKRNALPTELGDVLFQRSIDSIDKLKQCSSDILSNIVQTLGATMGPAFDWRKQEHLENCIKNIYLDQHEYQSSDKNKILEQFETYNDAYSRSLEWIKKKKQRINDEKREFNEEIEDMYKSFQDKTQNIVEKKITKYKETLDDNFSKQKEILKKMQMAKQKYIEDKNKKENNPQAMSKFNHSIAQKLKKYNPTECMDNYDVFETLKKKKEKLKIHINQQIVDLLLENCNNQFDEKEEKNYKPSDGQPVKCNKCSTMITEIDFQFKNVTSNMNDVFEHISCNQSLDRLYIRCYVSSISQYSLNATGSCTINALEAAIQLQMNRKPSITLVDEIVHLAALYKQDKHTAVSDIFPAVTRYKLNLEQVDWMQITVKNITNIIDAMQKILQNVSSTTNCVSAVLTKPPETIFMHLTNIGEIYIYDSHPRPQLNGSHFLVFDNRKNVELYLKQLWPYQHLGHGFNDLRSQQINMLDVSLFQLKSGVIVSKTPDLKLMGNELAKIGVSLENKWHNSYGQGAESITDKKRISSTNNYDIQKELQNVQNENVALKQHVEQLKEQVGIWQSQAMIQSQQVLNEPSTSIQNNNNNTLTKSNAASEMESISFCCDICQCVLPKESVFIYSQCNCCSCRHCAQKYFKQEFENGIWPMQCGLCGKNINENDFKLCSSEVCDLYNQQLKLMLNQFKEIECPWCKNVRMLKNWRTTQQSICCTNSKCGFTACKTCYVSWNGKNGQTGHSGLRCDEVRKMIKQPKYFRKCKCKKMIKNESGGNYDKYTSFVKCKNCGQITCFECGESFMKGIKHKCSKNKNWWDHLWNFLGVS